MGPDGDGVYNKFLKILCVQLNGQQEKFTILYHKDDLTFSYKDDKKVTKVVK